MGILSSLDLRFKKKTVNEFVSQYGQENVIVVKKSKFFLWTKVLIPFTFWTSLFIISLVLIIKYIFDYSSWLFWSTFVLSIFLWIVLNARVIKYYLDYKMDFIVVNPRSFIRFDQDGLFKKVSKTIDLRKVRSISVRKIGFWNSLFNNGTLVIVSEGGEAEEDAKLRAGEIVFNDVYNPEAYDKKINDFLNKAFNQ
ncbi:MAG TPA: hypothetical protein PLP73_04585 [Candidatus Absconditabacterales bacterium]|nr:hypothetical protein [Candidatus Absconditabacterales bacterium]HRU50383.1 hypothetical protein [Candidatus Absconditabacterales bacterium]